MYLKLLLSLFLHSWIAQDADAVSCLFCAGANTNGDKSCYNNATPDTVRVRECNNPQYYCVTLLVVSDDATITFQRACANPLRDEDDTTDAAPTDNRCSVKLLPGLAKEVHCSYPCKEDYCNNKTADAIMKPCKGGCSANGYCDYTKSECVCNEGWTGKNCKQNIVPSTPFRKCVQCNGLADHGCDTATNATLCPKDMSEYSYCATSRTTMFDKNQKEVRSYITRGCSPSYYHNDRCYFSPTSTQFDLVEYSCVSTCAHDGCNTDKPNGIISNHTKKDLYCLVCTSTDDMSDCALGNVERQVCPPHFNYCKSTVQYYFAKTEDVRHDAPPQYRFGKIVRRCAKSYVKPKCHSHFLGDFKAKKVKCEETCQNDGCNVGWPNRPSCSQCNSSYSALGYDSCWSSPQLPTQCPKPYDTHCVMTQSQQVQDGKAVPNQGFRRTAHRGCSYRDIGSKCEIVTYGDVTVQNCNRSCTVTGCNLGINGSSLISSSLCFIFSFLFLAFTFTI